MQSTTSSFKKEAPPIPETEFVGEDFIQFQGSVTLEHPTCR